MKKLTRKDKDWVERAINLEMTRLQVARKLKSVDYPEERIDNFLAYYDKLMDDIQEDRKEALEERNEEEKQIEEEETKEDLKTYFGQNEGKLSWGKKSKIKKFLKNINKYMKTMRISIEGFRKEIEYISNQGFESDKLIKEMEYLKKEIIDRLIESKEVLEIQNPVTKEEITKENLALCDINQLIVLMEENVEALDEIVNGRIA